MQYVKQNSIMRELEETFHQISYTFMGSIGVLFGSSWSVFKLMEISIEALLAGTFGGLGAAGAKFLFEHFFRKDKSTKKGK